MDINDLRSFLVVAKHANLRSAADELHQSPSALSKAIRRIETSINTPIFDRIGKTIRLNTDGERLRDRAKAITALADETQAEFRGDRQQIHCRIIGPALLQWRYAPAIASALTASYPQSGITFADKFEDVAIAALAQGHADFALITAAVVSSGLPAGIDILPLGQITMQLAAAAAHPIITGATTAQKLKERISANTEMILKHDFACPNHSQFCGIDRGSRSDGWRDDKLPRRVRFWTDDMQLLIALVRSGQALAYLPDFVLKEAGLTRLHVSDCAYHCVEQVFLAWRPSTASGWQNRLLNTMKKAGTKLKT
jgi:DNA-binding transcriptional LysR family regulator